MIALSCLAGCGGATGGGGATSAATAPPRTAGAPKAPTLVVRDGQPAGGVRKFRFDQGGTIDLTVRSDSAQDVHLHGYDVHRMVPAGGSARFRVPARIEGVFELELEAGGTKIASIEVVP